jgi:hypothetical protein
MSDPRVNFHTRMLVLTYLDKQCIYIGGSATSCGTPQHRPYNTSPLYLRAHAPCMPALGFLCLKHTPALTPHLGHEVAARCQHTCSSPVCQHPHIQVVCCNTHMRVCASLDRGGGSADSHLSTGHTSLHAPLHACMGSSLPEVDVIPPPPPDTHTRPPWP